MLIPLLVHQLTAAATLTGWFGSAPDAVAQARRHYQVTEQQAVAAPPPLERTSPLASTVFPDRVERPFFHASRQHASTNPPPKPEEKIQLDWSPSFPERGWKTWVPGASAPSLHASSQQATTEISPLPIPGPNPIPGLSGLKFYVDTKVAEPTHSGADVTAWDDLSAFGNDLDQVTANKPQLVSAGELKGGVRFVAGDATSLWRANAGLIGTGGYTIGIVFKVDQVIDNEVFISNADRLVVGTGVNLKINTATFTDDHYNAGVAARDDTNVPADTTNVHVFVVDRSGSGQAPVIYRDNFNVTGFTGTADPIASGPDANLMLGAFTGTGYSSCTILGAFIVDGTGIGPTNAAAVWQWWYSEYLAPLLEWAPRFPDSASRAKYPATAQQAFAGPVAPPEAQVYGWDPAYPDRASRAKAHPSALPFEARSLAPERTSPLAAAEYPARVTRPSLSAANQLAATEIPPRPERTQVLAAEVHQDRVTRPFLGAEHQLAVTELSPQPEEKVQLDWQPVYPDRATRAAIHPSRLPFVFPSAQPERTAPLASVEFPARIDRRTFHPAFQFDEIELPETPEERIQLDWQPSFPDSARRAFLPIAEHLDFAASRAPERTTALAWAYHPDRIDRATFHPSQQLDELELNETPEDKVSLDWAPHYPDRAVRAFLPRALHQAFADSRQPERTAPLASVTYPDRVDRPAYLAANQLDEIELNETPEEKAPLDWSPSYPDRATRARLQTAAHPAFVSSQAPERTAPLAAVYQPDRLDRRQFHASLHLDEIEAPEQPEETRQLDWQPAYPDRATRAFLASAEHQALAFAPAPERTAPLASASFPDTVRRAHLHASEQLDAIELPQAPEEAIPLDWSPEHPDSVTRATLPRSAYPAFATSAQPERSTPLSAESHPDRVSRPVYAASLQLAVTGLSPYPIAETAFEKGWDPGPLPASVRRAFLPAAEQQAFASPTSPERNAPLFSEVHPDRVSRPFARAVDQPFVTGLPPKPERKATFAEGIGPDRVLRATFGAHQQLASSEVSPYPIAEVPKGFDPVQPDRVLRAVFGAAEQPFFAFAPAPERKSPLASETYPDTVSRPFVRATDQSFAAALSPGLVAPRITDPVYPDRALRVSLRTSSHPSFGFVKEPEFPPLKGEAPPVFQAWIARAVFGAHQQLFATELPPRQVDVFVFPPLTIEQVSDAPFTVAQVGSGILSVEQVPTSQTISQVTSDVRTIEQVTDAPFTIEQVS